MSRGYVQGGSEWRSTIKCLVNTKIWFFDNSFCMYVIYTSILLPIKWEENEEKVLCRWLKCIINWQKTLFLVFSNHYHGSLLEVFRPKKCSSWFLNVIILHFVHWFQNCAQLNQSNGPNIPGFPLADNSIKAENQPMRNQDY